MKYPFLILDGAFSTELSQRGFHLDPLLWSAPALYQAPEKVKAIHLSYLRAGADIIESGSYQATYPGLRKKGFTENEITSLLRYSVSLAREAISEYIAQTSLQGRPFPMTAASVGPYGAYLADGSEYRGHYKISEKALRAFHEKEIADLSKERPDFIACETIPSLEEALTEASLLEELRQPGWISFSCADGSHTSEGEDIGDCAEALNAFSYVMAIGVNCTKPWLISSLIQKIKVRTSKVIIVYPDAGEAFNTKTGRYEGKKKDISKNASEWHALGAGIIGGCCETTPDMIRRIAEIRQKMM